MVQLYIRVEKNTVIFLLGEEKKKKRRESYGDNPKVKHEFSKGEKKKP